MKKLKSIASLFMAVVLLIAVIPLGTISAGAETSGIFQYEVVDGEAIITGCDYDAAGDITIPSIINGYPVTSIGEWAFYDCKSLTSITIPDSVTSIGDWAFDGCTELTGITIPDSVKSIGKCVFFSCNNLESIIVENGNERYHSAGNCLIETESKTLITGCNNSTIPADGSVTSIGSYAFEGCTGLTIITIPDSVTSIGNYAFYRCTGLTSITIPDSVTSIDEGAFYSCYSLTSITIPDSVTSIFNYAFECCTGLTSITIPDSVTSIGERVFSGCNDLERIIVENGNERYHSVGNCLIETESKTLITGCNNSTIPADGSVTSIGDLAFDGCTGLTSIIIPNSVTNIDGGAFRGCTGLTSITIPDSVTSIDGYAFSDCTGLTSITIPDSVTSIGDGVFSGCTGLISITIPDSVTSIGECAFWGCTGLTSITIPDSVTSIGWSAFYGCTGLTNITIPDSVTSIFNYAFEGCDKLQIVYLNGTKEEWGKIEIEEEGNDPLLNATKFFTKGIDENINWEYDLKTDTLTVSGKGEMNDYEDSAPFVNFSASAKKIVVRSGISSIGKKAFAGFSNVEKVVVPKSVKTIDSTSFSEIGENTKFVCSKGSVAEEIAKASMGEILTTAQPDLNGDEIISDKDAEKLLFHTFFPEEYNVDGYCDFDGDGEADTNDAVYILKHIYFPKFYPIA